MKARSAPPITVLARFEDVPAGRGRPCKLGAALKAAFEANGCKVQLADPLDMAVESKPGMARPRGTHGLVVTALSPLVIPHDLAVARDFEDRGFKVINSMHALEQFSDPAKPLVVLRRKGVPVSPWIWARKPFEPGSRGFAFPAVVEILGPGGLQERVEVHDAGSLDGILNLVWRKDGSAIIRGGTALADFAGCRVSVVGRKAFGFPGNPPAAAARAAVAAVRALGLDFGLFELRKTGRRYEVLSASPFPASGPDGARPEILDALVRLALEWFARIHGYTSSFL